MADASKLKGMRRGGLGAPPPLNEARADLGTGVPLQGEPLPMNTQTIARDRLEPIASKIARPDGRSMRRSGRTVQFATRVSPSFDSRIREIAMRDGMLLVEVLERALDAYEAERS